MVHLTRLNNQPLVLNADLIKFIETSPDTVITLITGEKLVVRETVEEVLKRVEQFQQKVGRRVGGGSGWPVPETGASSGEARSSKGPSGS
jgi:flagellar protein FlbD